MNSNINYGSLVISLDFEMMWGCHDWSTPQEYGVTNIKSVRYVIDSMLKMFSMYGVHATFATVGLVFCKNTSDVEHYLPSIKPTYENINLSPYKDDYINQISKENQELYFAPDVIVKLKSNKGIEIGTHTFSHYFCWEPGQSLQQFRADLQAMNSISYDNDIDIKSIVFPKNQVSSDYLKVCSLEGIKCYRGNSSKYFGDSKTKFGSLRNRICRLLDSYINVGGMTTFKYSDIDIEEQPLNIRASRMLRPYSKIFSVFEPLRLNRVQSELKYAALNNEVYHLWWHPHNFGANVNQNLSFLEKILKCYKECSERYGMKSYTMSELMQLLVETK